MAAGARSRGEAREAAPEKLQSLAEERFLAGDVAGALRVAREAQTRCKTPLPSSLAHALAAYEVHDAAAASRSGGTNWYAILGFGAGNRGAATREDIKRRYRRLCLVLHPDKNSSAAADGAFKLLQEAWAALSARHPPPPPSAEQKPTNQSRPPPAAAASRESQKRRTNPPAGSDTSYSYGWKPGRHAPANVDTPRRGGYGSLSSNRMCPVPGCGGQYMPCMVSVELWQLRCMSSRHEPATPPMSRDDLYDAYTNRFTRGGVYRCP